MKIYNLTISLHLFASIFLVLHINYAKTLQQTKKKQQADRVAVIAAVQPPLSLFCQLDIELRQTREMIIWSYFHFLEFRWQFTLCRCSWLNLEEIRCTLQWKYNLKRVTTDHNPYTGCYCCGWWNLWLLICSFGAPRSSIKSWSCESEREGRRYDMRWGKFI